MKRGSDEQVTSNGPPRVFERERVESDAFSGAPAGNNCLNNKRLRNRMEPDKLSYRTEMVQVPRIGNVNDSQCNQGMRSEEHTSELQLHLNLVCRLLLEKKKKQYRKAIVAVGGTRTWTG